MALFGNKNRKEDVLCGKCGATLSEGMQFCPYCGEKIDISEFADELLEDDKIEVSSFMHDSDRKALNALKAIPGFTPLLRTFINVWDERQFQIQNLSGNIKLGENQMSKYYNMLPPICEKLGIAVPDLYLTLDVYPQAWTSGDTKPFITITSGLIETVPDDLIPTVLAHECGHIACHHVLYSTMGQIILDIASGVSSGFIPFGLGKYVSLPLKVAYFYWMRCSELSADRAAAFYNGRADEIIELCMRFAGYDKDVLADGNVELFMQQAVEYKEMVKNSKWDKTLELFMLKNRKHPFVAARAYECNEWVKTDEFKDLVKNYEKAAL